MKLLTPMISDLVLEKHAYRQLLKVMDFIQNLAAKGIRVIREVFTFVDASSMASKISMWEGRDKIRIQ